MSQTEIPTSFAELLRTFRERAGLSQEALAEQAGLTPNAIGALERGERRYPYPNTRRALADALGLEPAEREIFMSTGLRKPASPFLAQDPTVPAASDPIPGPASFPVPLMGLVGRTVELDVIRQLLARADVRLLTLTGPGGVGKTRLALETLTHTSSLPSAARPDGVAMVDLAPIEAADFLPGLLQTLGLQDRGDLSPKEQLIAWLKPRRMLILLDNFEHVLPAALDLVELLQNCPGLKLLVTSREALQIHGEQIYPIPPLSAPAADPASLQVVLQHDAVRLFLQCAQSVRPDFTLTEENAQSVAQLCARLDGLPLAIELVAAHVLLYSPQALLAQLSRDPALLKGPLLKSRSRSLPARQQTMRAAIQWSYALLDGGEQALFRRMAVFHGGADLEAIGRVCCPQEDPGLVSEWCESLLRKNLLRVEISAPTGPRLSMLETIRAYGLEMLAQNDETGMAADAHAQYYLALARSARAPLFGSEQPEWLLRLDRETNNLRGAIRHALEMRDWVTAGGINWALWRYWWLRGLHRESRGWAETILAQAGSELSRELLAQAELMVGSMAWAAGDIGAGLEHCREAVCLCGRLNQPEVEAVALMMLGCNLISSGHYEGTDLLFRESAALFEQTGELWGAAFVTSYPGIGRLAQGDYAVALEMFESGLALARRAADPISMHQILYNLGLVWLSTGQPERAARAFAEGLALAVQVRDRGNQGFFMRGIAQAAAGRAPADEVARLIGAAEKTQESAGVPAFRYELEQAGYQQAVEWAQSLLGELRYTETFQAGGALSGEQARTLAFQLAGEIA